jgi:hypothetical protein
MPKRKAKNPFVFYSTIKLTEYTGVKASNLTELLRGIKELDGSVIFHHTHHFIQQLHFVHYEPRNDFAYWTAESLGEPELAEILNSIDPTEFSSIRELRNKIIEKLENFIKSHPDNRNVPEGKEFYFLKTNTVVFQTGNQAFTLDEFKKIIEKIGYNSIYYHLYESRLHKEQKENDFVLWFRDELKIPELAEKMSRFDLFTSSLKDIREEILKFLREYQPESFFERLMKISTNIFNMIRKK